jgi:YD repeat-containing protein
MTGPQNKSTSLCVAGYPSPSCGSTSVLYSNMPAGQYSVSFTATTSFGSYTFNTCMTYVYQGMALVSPGAGLKEFFYEGFEENSSAAAGNAHTGSKYWNSNYTVQFVKPNSRSYVIQWWNYANNKWNFNSQAYTGSRTLTGPVDDIRIFPVDALMSTYTYNPILGITSQTDPSGRVNYYEYDKLGRLLLVRDDEGKIIQKIDYKYQGQ